MQVEEILQTGGRGADVFPPPSDLGEEREMREGDRGREKRKMMMWAGVREREG